MSEATHESEVVLTTSTQATSRLRPDVSEEVPPSVSDQSSTDTQTRAPVRSSGRHCMVVHAYYPLGETRVQREAQALLDCGIDVHVICLRDHNEPRVDFDDGVTISRLPLRRHRGCGMLMQLMEYLIFFALASVTLTAMHLRRRFTTIQIHNLPDFLVFSALIPKLMGIPIILDLHDLMPELLAGRTDRSLDNWLVRIMRFQEQISCRFADHVVTVTDGWRQTLISRGVPARKVSVVMNVPDARVFRRGQRASCLPENGRLELLYHGTFTHRYGVDLIVAAMGLLRDELPNLHLTLLGDGELRDELVKQVRALSLEKRVTISDGMVGVDVLTESIRRADIGIVPNRTNIFTDGILPTKLLEFVAMEVPVIASRTPMVANYFDEDTVEFFSPGEAKELAARIRALHAAPARRQALAENATIIAQRFSWDATAAGYTALVRRLSPPAPKVDRARAYDIVTVERSRIAARPSDRELPTVRMQTSESDEHPAWDEFLANIPMGHHTQTSLWSQVRAAQGWRPVRIVGDRAGKIVGGAQILYKSTRLGRLGYITRGPVFAPGESACAPDLLDEIHGVLCSLKIRLLTLQPPGTEPSRPAYLDKRRFVESNTEIAPRATLLMNVRPNPEEMLASINRKTRYNIRLSGRKGVVVREGNASDLSTYHELLTATSARQGFEPYPLAYFEAMWRILHPRGILRLSIAELDGEPIAGQIAIPFGTMVVNKLSVWSGRFGNCRPNEAIQWSAIEWAHNHGYDVYDLEGIKLSAAQALLEGQSLPPSLSQSVVSFKLGFCDNVVVGPSAQVFIPNPMVRWGFRQLYPRLRDQRWMKSLAKSLRNQARANRGRNEGVHDD